MYDKIVLMSDDKNYYSLVIDTDAPSGNFETEITAFCFGVVGESLRGGKEVDDYLKNTFKGLSDMVLLREIDGVLFPCEIRLTPGYACHQGRNFKWDRDISKIRNVYGAYQSVEVFLKEPLSEEALRFVEQRAELFAKNNNFKILKIFNL